MTAQHANTKVGAMPPAWGKPAHDTVCSCWFVRLLGLSIVGDTAKGMATGSTKHGKR